MLHALDIRAHQLAPLRINSRHCASLRAIARHRHWIHAGSTHVTRAI